MLIGGLQRLQRMQPALVACRAAMPAPDTSTPYVGRVEAGELRIGLAELESRCPAPGVIRLVVVASVARSCATMLKGSDGEVARLVDQHRRFVGELLQLVVDLLQRARGGQRVLDEVGRVEHRELRCVPASTISRPATIEQATLRTFHGDVSCG